MNIVFPLVIFNLNVAIANGNLWNLMKLSETT